MGNRDVNPLRAPDKEAKDVDTQSAGNKVPVTEEDDVVLINENASPTRGVADPSVASRRSRRSKRNATFFSDVEMEEVSEIEDTTAPQVSESAALPRRSRRHRPIDQYDEDDMDF
ncbi:hypothetical protein AGDE_16474 [Angomonas deanei]|nr:hypothetical protein AGDE_16474 [Angomonas deanei]|eukprot:EPY17034.1 hypothetical protein AGDE_16474 [Angomonas deanei]